MKELINISKQQIGNEEVNAISSIELHKILEAKTEHSKWITRRINDLGLIDGIDFTPYVAESTGGRPSKEYILTIDASKHIAMAERNKKGKEVRMYFIEVERMAKEQFSLPKTFAEALKLAGELEEKRALLEAENKEIKPKADAYEVISNSRRLSTVSQIAALFDMGRNQLYKILKDDNFVMYNNKPYRKWINSAHFDYKVDTINGKQYLVTLITGKGIQMLQEKFNIISDEDQF